MSDQPSGAKPANHQPAANGDYWLDQPRNIKLIIATLATCCCVLFIADFMYHKHGHFSFENWPGFYAWYGFLSYCGIVLSAKQLRKLIARKENYYDDPDTPRPEALTAGDNKP